MSPARRAFQRIAFAASQTPEAQEAKAQAALRKAEPAAAVAAGADDAPAAGGGVASRIPSLILERSKAAKARRLGG